jgi:hypothetical protein
MVSRSAIRWTLGLAILATAGACMTPKPGLGPDRGTRSDVSLVTWTDGKPAYTISCDLPGGCQTRALALCSNGPYTVLSSENMPTVGNARAVLGAPSVTVRCGQG